MADTRIETTRRAMVGTELLIHLARICGMPPAVFDDGRICFIRPSDGSLPAAPAGCALTVVLDPDAARCRELGLEATDLAPTRDSFQSVDRPAIRMASLHAYRTFRSHDGLARPVISDAAGRTAWVELERRGRRCLVVGTALSADLERFRQGDPARALDRSDSARWDFAFERPNYLFEAQLLGLDSRTRHADLWCEVFAAELSRVLAVPRRPMLPNGARGALVITGDDDQAYLEKYAAQQAALAGLPITYLMHPLTRHDRATVSRMFGRRRIELGLHPDALETPGNYATRLGEQARWFAERFGFRAASIRNHGFLNDGYWGHLAAWQAAGLCISSNIPGLDGNLLNASLLPGRVLIDGQLTSHWSILTTFGDGMVFALGLSDEAAATRVAECASDIVASGLPGVIVINLHPQNIDSTLRLHGALGDVARMGFVTWTLADCRRWFEALDRRDEPRPLMHAAATAARRMLGIRS